MTIKEFAYMLDGREMGAEITRDEQALAKELGFVVVFGYSDDVTEFRGAIDDEVGAGTIFLTENKIHKSSCDDDNCPYLKAEKAKCRTIQTLWCQPSGWGAWTYETDIPHETFHIFDTGDEYCTGIVFDIRSLAARKERGYHVRYLPGDLVEDIFGSVWKIALVELHLCNEEIMVFYRAIKEDDDINQALFAKDCRHTLADEDIVGLISFYGIEH